MIAYKNCKIIYGNGVGTVIFLKQLFYICRFLYKFFSVNSSNLGLPTCYRASEIERAFPWETPFVVDHVPTYHL